MQTFRTNYHRHGDSSLNSILKDIIVLAEIANIIH